MSVPPVSHDKVILGRGITSIGRLPLPMLEVLCKPTLTLFVKKPFLFWRKKNFPEIKSATVRFWHKADTQSWAAGIE